MVDQTVRAGAWIVVEPCHVQTPLVGGMLGVARLCWWVGELLAVGWDLSGFLRVRTYISVWTMFGECSGLTVCGN